jgi:hypothetical protein
LHPIGPDEIENATLDPAVIEPQRDRLTPASLRPFAFERPEIFRPLLAALSSVLVNPRMVVLVERDPAVAACWFAAMQYFLPPAMAWSIPFDTYRRPADLLRSRAQLGLVAVSDEDAQSIAALRNAGMLVISTLDPPTETTASAGQPAWHGISMEPLVADTWAMLAFQVLDIDPWTQQTVFVQLDGIANALSAGGISSPRWSLPAALMSVTGALGEEAADTCADLLITLWPTEETLPEAVSTRLREQASIALREPYRTFRACARRIAGTEAKPSDFTDLVIGGYLANSLAADLAEEGPWWLPPTNAMSPTAYQQLLDAMPGLLSWIQGVSAPDLRAARAVAIAGLLVDGAPGEASVAAARSSMETAMYEHLLPILAADDAEAASFTALAPPTLAGTLWENGVQRFLTTLCGARDAPVPAEFEAYGGLIERFRSGVPGERLAPEIHEWLSSWLDALLTEPVSVRPGSLTLEQAAYRITSPREGIDLRGARIWAYLARLEYAPSTVDPAHWPLTAARLTWGDDLREVVAIAGQLLPRMSRETSTPELLDALLLASPLAGADELLSTWRGPREGPLYQIHVEYRFAPRVFQKPERFLQVDREVSDLVSVLEYSRAQDPDGSSAFAKSARRWLATHTFSFDLHSAIVTFRDSPGRIASVRLKEILSAADYEAAWQELCRPSPVPSDRRERLMAMLHVRSLLNFTEDPAREWLVNPRSEDGKRPIPAFSIRLRQYLQHCGPHAQEVFTEEVQRRAESVANSPRCQHEINREFDSAKDFLRACNQLAARQLPAGGATSKSGMHR